MNPADFLEMMLKDNPRYGDTALNQRVIAEFKAYCEQVVDYKFKAQIGFRDVKAPPITEVNYAWDADEEENG